PLPRPAHHPALPDGPRPGRPQLHAPRTEGTANGSAWRRREGAAGVGGVTMLNRLAMVVTAKRPLVDWVNAADPGGIEITLETATEDNNVYLLPECDSPDDYRKLLGRIWPRIFEAELWAWYTDEALWPPNRTLEMFNGWFDCN